MPKNTISYHENNKTSCELRIERHLIGLLIVAYFVTRKKVFMTYIVYLSAHADMRIKRYCVILFKIGLFYLGLHDMGPRLLMKTGICVDQFLCLI